MARPVPSTLVLPAQPSLATASMMAPLPDSTTAHTSTSTNTRALPLIEDTYVREFYDTVATAWDETRTTQWPGVEAFVLGHQAAGATLIADIGCGNGRFMPGGCVTGARDEERGCDANKAVHAPTLGIGVDISLGLLNICASRQLETFAGDVAGLPFRTGIFDAAISIAVLHHLSTSDRRTAALKELVRIVKPGGRVLVYAWRGSKDHQAVCKEQGSQDVLVPFTWSSPSPCTHETPGARSSQQRSATGLVPNPAPRSSLPSHIGMVDPRNPCTSASRLSIGHEDAREACQHLQQSHARAPVTERYCHLFQTTAELKDLVDKAVGKNLRPNLHCPWSFLPCTVYIQLMCAWLSALTHAHVYRVSCHVYVLSISFSSFTVSHPHLLHATIAPRRSGGNN